MSPIDILLDVALVGSTVSARVLPGKRSRYAAIAVMAVSYFAVVWSAITSPAQQEVVAIYLAAVFVTSAMRVFRGNRYIAVGLSLMFVSTDLRLFLLHQMPVLSGITLTILFAVIQAATLIPWIDKLVERRLDRTRSDR